MALGIAFQLADDALDYGATAEALALLRNLPSVREGMPQGVPAAVVTMAPVVVADPLPPPAVIVRARPGWCDTASGPETRRVAYIRECGQ